MKFDIRVPIGLLFVAIGAMLLCHGLFAPHVDVRGANGHNVNAWWGALMAAFGFAMLALARRAGRR